SAFRPTAKLVDLGPVTLKAKNEFSFEANEGNKSDSGVGTAPIKLSMSRRIPALFRLQFTNNSLTILVVKLCVLPTVAVSVLSAVVCTVESALNRCDDSEGA